MLLLCNFYACFSLSSFLFSFLSSPYCRRLFLFSLCFSLVLSCLPLSSFLLYLMILPFSSSIILFVLLSVSYFFSAIAFLSYCQIFHVYFFIYSFLFSFTCFSFPYILLPGLVFPFLPFSVSFFTFPLITLLVFTSYSGLQYTAQCYQQPQIIAGSAVPLLIQNVNKEDRLP